MDLVFITEARYTKNKNQKIYYENTSFSYEMWKSYLQVFDNITVVARVDYDENHVEANAFIAEGERVRFIELPYFVGAKAYLQNQSKLNKKLKDLLTVKNAAYLTRIPGNVGHNAIKLLIKNKIPYGVEVVGDPWDMYAPNSIQHPLRKLVRVLSYRRLKVAVKNAKVSLFVTEKYLQKRYKPAENTFSIGVSDVILNGDDFFPPKSDNTVENDIFEIISVGSLERMYKSPDVLLKAIQIVVSKGYKVRLNWLGDGIFKEEMIKLSKDLGVADSVNFIGNVGRQQVRQYLRKADLFVLISKTEGLPRAMIEAMANGLPCMGTKVGGIPELIAEECLVDTDDVLGTANLIMKFITDNEFRKKHSSKNFENSLNFENEKLKGKRKLFLQNLKKAANI